MALIQNKRARHDYTIEERFEAGIVLQGWEVKSVRASRAQLNLAISIFETVSFSSAMLT